MFLTVVDAKEGHLHIAKNLLCDIFLPMMKNMNLGWGYLAGPQNKSVQASFLYRLEKFSSSLQGQSHLENIAEAYKI